MRISNYPERSLLVALALLGALAASPQDALAQGSGATVWFIDAASLDEAIPMQVRIVLEETLTEEQGRHVIGREAFEQYVTSRDPETPPCLYGEGQCVSAESMAFDALDLTLVVRVKIRKSDGQYEAAYRLIDRRGAQGSRSDEIVRAASARDLAIALVREIYDATGEISFDSTPPGANVIVDGAVVGITPMSYRLPIGRHTFALESEGYQIIERSVEVLSEGPTRVEIGLQLKPGVLILDDAPPGAIVDVEGGPQGLDAAQPLELPAGEHAYTVRAEGFRARQERVVIEPGLALHRDAALEQSGLRLGEVNAGAIENNRYVLRLSGDISFQDTSFRGARARGDGGGALGDVAFERFEQEEGSSELDPRRFFSTRGLRLDFSYMWRDFGIGLLSLAYLTDSTRRYAAIVEDLQSGQERFADVVRVSRFQVKPLQLQYRRLIDQVAPFAELGLGINFQWVTLVNRGERDDQAYSLRQSEVFWGASLGAQYFFSSNWFAVGRYSFHDHFNLGVGTEHTLSLGVGGAFSNLFGFEPEPPAKL